VPLCVFVCVAVGICEYVCVCARETERECAYRVCVSCKRETPGAREREERAKERWKERERESEDIMNRGQKE